MIEDPAQRAPRWAELPEPVPSEQWTTLQVVDAVPLHLLDHSPPLMPHCDGGDGGGDC